MPFYLFKITFTTDSGVNNVSGIRELDEKDLDTVWRQYKRICEQKYSRRLHSFEVVHLSKLDPRVMKFQHDRGNKSRFPDYGQDVSNDVSGEISRDKNKHGFPPDTRTFGERKR